MLNKRGEDVYKRQVKKSLGLYIIEKAIDDDTLDELYEGISSKDLKKFIRKYGNKVYNVEEAKEDKENDDLEDEEKNDLEIDNTEDEDD